MQREGVSCEVYGLGRIRLTMNGTKRMMRIGNLTTPGVVDTTVIDVGQCLSQENRRLYRQGMRYTVKLDFESQGNPLGRYKVYALNDTWSTQGAWKKALESHMNNSIEEEGRKGRWNDFRVKHGWTAGGVSQGFPMAFAGNDIQPRPLSAGEFVFSQSRTEAGGVFEYTWGPSSSGNFSIVEEFDKLAQVSVEPSHLIGDMPYSELDDDTSDQQMAHLENSGRQPPYNRINSNLYEWNLIADISQTGDGTTQSTGFFDAPCGLIVVVGYYKPHSEFDPLTDTLLKVTCAQGNYKGVKATPLGIAKKVGALEYKVQ